MKGILVTTDNEIKEVELHSPLYLSAGGLLGGNMERVCARRLERPYCLVVNGEGDMLGLPVNKVGCYLFESEENGFHILGDILIMKEKWTSGGAEIAGMDEDDIAVMMELLEDVLPEAEIIDLGG